MAGRGALVLVVIGLGAALGAGASALVATVSLRAWRRRRTGPMLEQVQTFLAHRLAAGECALEDAVIQPLPRRHLQELLTRFSRSLAGADVELRPLAEQAGLVDEGLRLTKSRFWWRRLAGARLLTTLDLGSSWAEALAADRNPLVRAQVSIAAAHRPTDALIDHLIGQLADADGLCRFRAQDSLTRVGERAAAALSRCLAQGERGQLANALAVAVHVDSAVLAGRALGLLADGSPRIRARAAAVIGHVGEAAMADRLEALLVDPDSGVRGEAARALGRLGAWQTAASLERLLGDSSWDVRRAGALALADLGPPGMLLLRAATRAPERFAADMARQVLDMAELERAA